MQISRLVSKAIGEKKQWREYSRSQDGNLIADKSGNLYGTTSVGGPNGAGTVFKLAPDGTETVIYHFTGAVDGDLPMSSLLMDKEGNFYGVTEIGGANGLGNVFKVTPDGVQTTLYSFGANRPMAAIRYAS